MTPEERARALPDTPRLVETRAMLLSGRGRVFEDASGYVVLDRDLAGVVGAPSAAVIREAVAAAAPGLELLVAEDGADAVAQVLPDWRGERAIVHALPAPPPAWPAPAGALRFLDPSDRLDHLPEDLREELEDARDEGTVSAALVADLPVSFCYAGSITESWWDISIDTLAPYRSRGLGRAAVQHHAAHMRAVGKAPVWGAFESNQASRRLAAALGFVPVDGLVVFERGAAISAEAAILR